MKTILDRIALVLENLLTTGSHREYEGYLRITASKVSATDGRILLEVKNNNMKFSDSEGEVFLSKNQLKKIKKVLAKEVDKFIVERVVIPFEGEDEIKVLIEDYEGETEMKFPARDIDYPDTEQIYRDTEPKLSVSFSLAVLKKLIEVLYRFKQETEGIKSDRVKFLFYGEEEPVEIRYETEDTEVRGAVMPLRRDKDD